MKKLYFLLLLSFFLQKANSQWVTIPGPNFVTFLQQNYPGCMNGNQIDTTCSAIVNENEVNCFAQGISDLWGIQYFDNLQYLNCWSNQLTSLPTLPSGLWSLQCDDNQLTMLPQLPNGLLYLICSYNNLDLLWPLPNTLIQFDTRNNQHGLLPPLPNSLEYFNCSNNFLDTLPSLPGNLTQIDCSFNNLISLPSLPNTLTSLDVKGNQLTTLPTLSSSLSYLDCSGNDLISLPSLPNGLQYLNCSYNLITSLPTLPNNLKSLFCEWNQLTMIPDLPDTLNNFYINVNPNLTCLPQLKNINKFYYGGTGISCLPNNPNLFGNNPIANPPLGTYPICNTTINTQITSPITSLCGVTSITLSADTGAGYSYQWQLNGNNISGATSQTYDATVAGDYTVIVTYNCALDTSNTITITSGAAPSAAITASGPASFCSGGSVTLDANTGTGLTYQWQVDGNNITGASSSSYTATATGNYTVMVSNNCGNSISNIITVNVTSTPGGAGTIAGPTSFCRHSTQTLSVAAVTGATNYVWSVPPQATIISGAGTNSITVSFIVKQGDVTVKAANQCGSGPLSVLPVQVLKCANPNSSINSPLRTGRNSETFIFPNPASSAVTIQFNSAEENNYVIKFYDIHGRMVLTQNSIAGEGMNEFTFDVEFLSKGIYIIEVGNGNDKVIKKLVIN